MKYVSHEFLGILWRNENNCEETYITDGKYQTNVQIGSPLSLTHLIGCRPELLKLLLTVQKTF